MKNRACERELDAQRGVPVPLGLEGAPSETSHYNTTTADTSLGDRGHERLGMYCWGIDGHDLTSIYADQQDHYYSVMTTTAVPATSLEMGDQFRGPADTVLEEIPEAVLYEYYPEADKDEARKSS